MQGVAPKQRASYKYANSESYYPIEVCVWTIRVPGVAQIKIALDGDGFVDDDTYISILTVGDNDMAVTVPPTPRMAKLHTCSVVPYLQPEIRAKDSSCILPPPLEDLSKLEERLVSARLSFMQSRLLGLERQLLLRENFVIVENDLDFCVEVLPQTFNDTSIITVDLMRRMNCRHHYTSAFIRPSNVYKAAQYLLKPGLDILTLELKNAVIESETMLATSMNDLPQRSTKNGVPLQSEHEYTYFV